MEKSIGPKRLRSISAVEDRPFRERSLGVGIAKGSLLDFETTGLDPATDMVLTVGYIAGSHLRILQRTTQTDDFDRHAKDVLSTLPEPIFAYNASFEERWLKSKYGIQRQFADIMLPWKRRAETEGRKWPKLEELLPDPETYFGEAIVSGRHVPELWAEYLRTKEVAHLDKIVRHNEIDLLRELMLLVRYGVD